MSKKALLLITLMVAAGAVAGLARALGPGDPTTVVASGFDRPCRIVFDASGDLLIAELGLGQILRVKTDGSRSLVSDAVADPRGISLDALGNLLVTSSNDSALYRARLAFGLRVDCGMSCSPSARCL